jgi:hypothetical protein
VSKGVEVGVEGVWVSSSLEIRLWSFSISLHRTQSEQRMDTSTQAIKNILLTVGYRNRRVHQGPGAGRRVSHARKGQQRVEPREKLKLVHIERDVGAALFDIQHGARGTRRKSGAQRDVFLGGREGISWEG